MEFQKTKARKAWSVRDKNIDDNIIKLLGGLTQQIFCIKI